MTDVIFKLWPWVLLLWLGAHVLVAVMDRLADRREERARRDAQEDLDDLREVFGRNP